MSKIFFLKRILIPISIALTFSTPISVSVSASASTSVLNELEQTTFPESFIKQAKTTAVINSLIKTQHFRKISLNDDFSEKILNKYIEQLDPSRSFFLLEDIQQFQTLKHKFDDYINNGVLEPAYTIFKIYRSRVNQRVTFALKRLNKSFDFSIDEEYLLDRTDAQWASSVDELDDLWRKRIKNDIINLRLAKKSKSDIVETLDRRYTHIARRTGQFKSEDVFQSFINAYVSSIEPHTSYYSPRGAENFKIHMRLSLEGIGAVLQTDNEHTLVRRIIPGGPADLSGYLNADDRIIGVGQKDEDIVDVIGWRLDDVVDLIRGPKETVVKLEILPAENGLDSEPEVIIITRDKIKLEEQAASKRVLDITTKNKESKVGVIRLPSFYSDFDGRNINDPNYRSTTKDVRKLLSELQDENVDGIVIDLRGNGGGALTEAISLTGLFIRRGPVVQVQYTRGTQIDRDPDPEIVYNGPLAVLVDRYSASASEIFAGAIQDYNRGLILGESTFGKGTVQNLINLNNYAGSDDNLGQLKVTIAQFFRVNGESTQHRGVEPDISWDITDQDTDSGERYYENAIPWRQISKAAYIPYQSKTPKDILDRLLTEHRNRAKDSPEFNYVQEVSAINKINRERKFISLMEEKRKSFRTQRDQQRLELENKRRIAQGKEKLSSIESLDEEQSQNDRDDDELNDDSADNISDAFLFESGRILIDYDYYTKAPENSEAISKLVE